MLKLIAGPAETRLGGRTLGATPSLPKAQQGRAGFASFGGAAFVATALALVFCTPSMAFDGANATVGPAADERTADVSPGGAEVQLHPNVPAGSTSGAGDGALKMTLPGDGQFTLRLPTTPGATEARVDYHVVDESRGFPSVAVAALVHVSAPAGMPVPQAAVKTTAIKQIGSRFVESIHLESELRTDGANPSYRIAAGTILRLGPGTSGSLDFIDQQEGCRLGNAGSPSSSQVGQFSLSHKFDASTAFRFGLARDLGDVGSLRATIGIDRHF